MKDPRSPSEIKVELGAEVAQVMTRYPSNRSAIMPALDLAQQRYGQVDGMIYQAVAEMLDVPEIWVFEVASFYSLYDRAATGRHHLRLCTNLPCMLRGSDGLMQHLQQRLDLAAGGTSADGCFSLSGVECLGACETAPALMVNDEYHGDLTVEKLDELLATLRVQETGDAT